MQPEEGAEADHPLRYRAEGRIAQRFLISVLRQYGREAPALLRSWADELEGLAKTWRSFGTVDVPLF